MSLKEPHRYWAILSEAEREARVKSAAALLTAKGWKHAEQLTRRYSESQQSTVVETTNGKICIGYEETKALLAYRDAGGVTCAACDKPAKGEFAIHRDGFGEGPEVLLCNDCGESVLPTCEELWERIAARLSEQAVKQVGTHTGRLAASEPNLSHVPHPQEAAGIISEHPAVLAEEAFTNDEKRGIAKLEDTIRKAAKTVWDSHPNNPKNKATPTLIVRELLNAIFHYDPTSEITIGVDGCLYVEDEAIGKVRRR